MNSIWIVVVTDANDYGAFTFRLGDQAEAEMVARRLNDVFSANGSDEMWAGAEEVRHLREYDIPEADKAAIARQEALLGRPVKPTEFAMDVEKFGKMLIDRNLPELRPEEPKVTDDDVQKAIASITGSGLF